MAILLCKWLIVKSSYFQILGVNTKQGNVAGQEFMIGIPTKKSIMNHLVQ